ncbi:farnesyl pyrophosphate synthase isoform X2 [Eurosta solidaginis]|uniref:farnesyl pyrophosphate synthase isoform X2 n=1 Tax=Eurosta solidaginis TaxID=178769 RepID=UPI003530FC1B
MVRTLSAITLTTLSNQFVSVPAHLTMSKDDTRDFEATFPDIIHDLTNAVKSYQTPEAAEWYGKALQYNLPRGKKTRGLLTVLTYKNLVKPEERSPENLKLANYLGWCIEMVQCFFIMFDDIMDNSTTRRGQLCWHKLEDVGLIAINDALMIESGIYALLRKHFRHLDCYIDLIELFTEATFITTSGQALDVLNASKNVSEFTIDKYDTVVRNKTSYYTFYFPVAAALHLAGVKDPEVFRECKIILLEMGHFFQVQDDFLDCYGNPDITGKLGTDIQDNKCSWLAVMCMQRANAAQKALMAECYGQNDPDKVSRIKQLYEELNIADIYAKYEEESYNLIKEHIQRSSRGIPQEIFIHILNKIHHRDA